MTDFPPLKIDYWIYTIGPKGGLYHQYEDSKEGPTRIHHSHPPIEHQPIVKEWQDRYVKQKGIALPKRFNPKYPKKLLVKSEIKLEKAQELILIEKMDSLTMKSKSKISKKKSSNLSPHQIETLLAEPSVKQIVVCEAKKCLLVPSTKEIAHENVNKITRLYNKFIPEWVSLNLPLYLNTPAQIYYSNDIELEEARKYATERALIPEEDYSSLGFSGSFYGSKKSLDPLKGLLGFYCDADISFDNGKTKYKLHVYQGGEPLITTNIRATYEQIFAKMFLCALTNKLDTIILQIDNCLNAIDEIIIGLLAILRNVKTIAISFISNQNSDFLLPIRTEFKTQTFLNLEEAIKQNTTTTTLFASLCDMRFLLSNSMFLSCSSLPLHIYGLTNMNLNDDNNFVIH